MNSDFMAYAAALAEKGRGYTQTNPCVGAVIVRNDTIVAGGWHKMYGGPHAEIEALREAGDNARGADLYVTLEPCSTYGKTPPCTNAIINAGIKRVFIGVLDPNPDHAGKGIQLLRSAGIEVVTGVNKELCAGLIADFAKYKKFQIPYTSLKIAQSLDGKIATSTGESKWITSETSRRYVHHLRKQSDAVLVGVGTVLADDPELTVRYIDTDRQPIRVVLDSQCRLPLNSKLVTSANKGVARTIIYTSTTAPEKKVQSLLQNNVEVVSVESSLNGLDIAQVMHHLGSIRIMNLLVEGGSSIFASFIKSGFADRLYMFIAPLIIGGGTPKSSIGDINTVQLISAPRLTGMSSAQMGDDILLKAYFNDYSTEIINLTDSIV